jgi:hypothetical protein
MKTVSSMVAASPKERPITLVSRVNVSRLTILNIFLKVKGFAF